MSERARYTIKVQEWTKLPPSTVSPRRTGDEAVEISKHTVDWTEHPIPIGNMTYYPNGDASRGNAGLQRVRYTSERGENCSTLFEGDPREQGGTQCYTHDGPERRFVSSIHLDFEGSIEWGRGSRKSERTKAESGTSTATVEESTSGEKNSRVSKPKRLVPRTALSELQVDDIGTEKPLTENEKCWREFRKKPREKYQSTKESQGLRK